MRKKAPPVILASASPRRRELLAEWGVKYTLHPSSVDERTRLTRPSAIVRELALRKAASVAKVCREGIVIGADTIVVLKGRIIGKPRSEAHSYRILSSLNGSYHRVYSGIAVIDAATGRTAVGHAVSRVKMRRFSDGELRRLSGKHMDKAGAYAVQEKDDAFVERIEGDYFNVVGLPYDELKRLIEPFGVTLKKAVHSDHIRSFGRGVHERRK
jgi:septum formation protein